MTTLEFVLTTCRMAGLVACGRTPSPMSGGWPASKTRIAALFDWLTAVKVYQSEAANLATFGGR